MKICLRRWEQAGEPLHSCTSYLLGARMELSGEERRLIETGAALRQDLIDRWRFPAADARDRETVDRLLAGEEQSFSFGSFVDADAAEKRLRETMIEISGRLRAVRDGTFASDSGSRISHVEKGQVAP